MGIGSCTERDLENKKIQAGFRGEREEFKNGNMELHGERWRKKKAMG